LSSAFQPALSAPQIWGTDLHCILPSVYLSYPASPAGTQHVLHAESEILQSDSWICRIWSYPTNVLKESSVEILHNRKRLPHPHPLHHSWRNHWWNSKRNRRNLPYHKASGMDWRSQSWARIPLHGTH
jgi:hypothetical protein